MTIYMASPAQEHALSDLGIFNFTISDEARVKYVVCILHHCNSCFFACRPFHQGHGILGWIDATHRCDRLIAVHD